MSVRLVPSLTAALLLAAVGCRERPSPGGPDAGSPTAPAAAATAAPEELELVVHAGLADGGTVEVPIEPGERPTIDPVQRLEVTSNLPLKNYRVRLFDEVDRAMVSNDSANESDAGIRYEIALENPLKTGHKYSVVVDPQSPPTFSDSYGRTYAEKRVTVIVAGEKEKPEPPAKKKPARKKRR